jgi:hypothetical protein
VEDTRRVEFWSARWMMRCMLAAGCCCGAWARLRVGLSLTELRQSLGGGGGGGGGQQHELHHHHCECWLRLLWLLHGCAGCFDGAAAVRW